jgi:hypothetical protein
MSQAHRRRIAGIEKLGVRFSEALQWTKTQMPDPSDDAMTHATNLGFLVKYGNPKVGEPLTGAWQRALDKKDAEFDPKLFNAFAPQHARFAANWFREDVFSAFFVADEKERVAAILASAPPWLVWFTYGDFTAECLGIKVPDLSSVTRFVRSKATFKRWPALPAGMFELCPWPDGSDNEPITQSEAELLRNELLHLNENSTPRERQRARDIYPKYGDGR